jgi:LPS-assembly lipoprotein
MSLRNSVIVILIPLLLAGCGFTPLYAKKSPEENSKLFAGVKVETIPGRPGQILKIGLEDKLNANGVVPPSPAFRLTVTLVQSETPIGVSSDGTVSRYNVYLNSSYVLRRTSDDKEVTSGNINYVSSYNNLTNAYFSTYVSKGDAIKRGLGEVTELYRQRLATYLDAGAPIQQHAPEPPPSPATFLPPNFLQ